MPTPCAIWTRSSVHGALRTMQAFGAVPRTRPSLRGASARSATTNEIECLPARNCASLSQPTSSARGRTFRTALSLLTTICPGPSFGSSSGRAALTVLARWPRRSSATHSSRPTAWNESFAYAAEFGSVSSRTRRSWAVTRRSLKIRATNRPCGISTRRTPAFSMATTMPKSILRHRPTRSGRTPSTVR